MDGLFTPRMIVDGKWVRLKMQLSETDIKKIRSGGRWQTTVTDTLTGKRYKARGASCGLPNCYCDAIVKEV